MTQALAIRTEDGMGLQALGTVFVQSGYFKDVKSAQQSIVKVLAGRELGIGPFAAQTSLHIIEGKPVLSANLLAAAIKRSGKYTYRVKQLDDTGCVIVFLERNGDKWDEIGVSAFTEKEAKAAGLAGKDNWKKYGKAMYFARAISQGQRWHCPDVFSSAVYTPDEMEMTVNSDGEAINVQTVEPLPSVAASLEAVKVAHTTPVAPKPLAAPKAAPAAPKPVQQAPQQDGTAAIGVVEAVDEKKGTSAAGKEWTKFGVKIDGQYYGTFDVHVGADAQDWIGTECEYGWQPSKNPKYRDLLWLRPCVSDSVTFEEVSVEDAGFAFGYNAPAAE